MAARVANLETGKSGQVITGSYLGYGTPLPTTDPRHIELPEIPYAHSRFAVLLDDCSHYRRLNVNKFARSGRPVWQQLLDMLNSEAVQFNSKQRFRQYEVWAEAFQTQVEKKNRPVDVVIPVFSSIGNELKRFSITSVTAGEVVTLHALNNLAEESKKLYAPGLHFQVIADSNFYSTPFLINSVETESYIHQLKSYIAKTGLGENITLTDMVDILKPVASDFSDSYRNWLGYFRQGGTDGVPDEDIKKWRESILASINLRRFNLEYAELLKIYSSEHSEFKNYFLRFADKALAEYRALKYAAADMRWEDLRYKTYIRATIHKKKNPVLGLRIYPEYKFRCKLLPYLV